MTITVLLFAGVRQIIGKSQLVLELPPEATIADLRAALAHEYPLAKSLLERSRFAVDNEFAGLDHPVRPTHEIAVVPPVSGGSEHAS